MKVLVIGSGGRKHALLWKLKQSPSVGHLAVAPGSDALAELAAIHAVPLDALDDLAELSCRFDLVVVGPEAPLAAGLADRISARQVPVFGCSQAASLIEASKGFAKKLMERAGVAVARNRVFDNLAAAELFLDELAAGGSERVVVKADGLAGGKGSILCYAGAEARDVVRRMLAGSIVGDAGRRVVIEEHLRGREATCMALADGERCWMLAPCEDHKALGDGDLGPMTGGMGAISPTPVIDQPLLERIEREVFRPTLSLLAAEGRAYRGLLYAGLMITERGPRVLEFNCRFGDPEAQALLPRLTGDLAAALLAVAEGRAPAELRFAGAACSVVMAARGYPGAPEKGALISGVEEAQARANTIVFHAGTRRAGSPAGWRVDGGRVLAVTGVGDNLAVARARAYDAIEKIHFAGAHFRRDIGARSEATR